MKTRATAEQLEILTIWRQLGPNAQHILLRLGQRMAKGAKQYGDFPARSWRKEAAEEALDLGVYLMAELELDPKKLPKPKRRKAAGSKKTSVRASR